MKTEDGRLKKKPKGLSPTANPSTQSSRRTGNESLTSPQQGQRSLAERLAMFDPAFVDAMGKLQVEMRVEMRAGPERLWGYLRAPKAVQEAFDRSIARAIEERWPMPKWTKRWERRAHIERTTPGARDYRSDSDPVLAVPLEDVWPLLCAGDVVRGMAPCPHPDHDDRSPSASVRGTRWRCFGCGAKGSIIDLGGFAYGMVPRGRDYFDIRNRVAALLGEEAV